MPTLHMTMPRLRDAKSRAKVGANERRRWGRNPGCCLGSVLTAPGGPASTPFTLRVGVYWGSFLGLERTETKAASETEQPAPEYQPEHSPDCTQWVLLFGP